MKRAAGGGVTVAAAAGGGAASTTANQGEGNRKTINAELWHACAGPLVSLPLVGSLVVYFPQGHSEQVAASMHKDVDAHIPNYPNLPSKMICLLHSVTLHADSETDEVYAQMTLQPVTLNEKDAMLAYDFTMKPNKPQIDFFCKTLTASDTSTHGGFSVPRRAAEKIFPPLDFTMQPPAQELQARDLHENLWNFRHIYRGQPKRHLLTTGWSLFVSGKRLFAGDSVLFIRDEKQQLLLGIRRSNRQPANISSSVLSSDSMHIGILAAAAHAAVNNSPFTVFYNPRASPSEFVIPFSKYQKSVYGYQISTGMRFRMMFETEESGTRRYMGTITGVSDLDPVRWKNSQWRNLQVGWDESAAGERRNRVSIWEIEPVQAPFFLCPPPFFRTSKRPRQPGVLDDESLEMENLFKRAMPWLSEEICIKDANTQSTTMPGLSLVQWMNMQQNPTFGTSQPDYFRSLSGPVLQNYNGGTDLSRQLGFQAQLLQQSNIQLNTQRLAQQTQQQDQFQKIPVPLSQLASVTRPIQQFQDGNSQLRQNYPTLQNVIQPQILVQNQPQQQQQPQIENQHLQTHTQNPKMQQQQQIKQQNSSNQNRVVQFHQPPNNQQFQLPEHQIQLQLLQKLQQQQQLSQLQEQQRALPAMPPQVLSMPSSQQPLTQQNSKVSHVGPQFPRSSPPPPAQQKLQPGSCLLVTGGAQSVLTTDDVPSCSTSPSTNNCSVPPQSSSKGIHECIEKTPSAGVLSPDALDALVLSSKVVETSKPEQSLKPLVDLSRVQNHCGVPHRLGNAMHMEYLDTSSSATSACVAQSDGALQPGFHLSSFNQLSVFREDNELQDCDPRNNVIFGVNIDGHLGIPLNPDSLLQSGIDEKYQNQLSCNADVNYDASRNGHNELPPSLIAQSFGVPDLVFDSTNPTINDGGLLNQRSWAAAPQYQRMRTYTKVYKRGAVGRSIDIARYSGYDELKYDLARMFSIEGQLEEQQRIGWKLVYEDHDKDILLVGDDPWEEFVNCVRCIRILSPQEVQQMSLDVGEIGNNGLVPNQDCSSSDGGNVWRGPSNCDQSSGNNPSVITDHLE